MKSAIIEAAEEFEALARQIIRVCSRHNGHDWDMSDAARADHERLLNLAQRLRAGANRPAIPEGWKLVPVEPTAAMLIRGGEEFFDSARNREIGSTLNDQDHAAMIYEGMLAAAPPPASDEVEA